MKMVDGVDAAVLLTEKQESMGARTQLSSPAGLSP